jgi:hypothetical protein
MKVIPTEFLCNTKEQNIVALIVHTQTLDTMPLTQKDFLLLGAKANVIQDFL